MANVYLHWDGKGSPLVQITRGLGIVILCGVVIPILMALVFGIFHALFNGAPARLIDQALIAGDETLANYFVHTYSEGALAQRLGAGMWWGFFLGALVGPISGLITAINTGTQAKAARVLTGGLAGFLAGQILAAPCFHLRPDTGSFLVMGLGVVVGIGLGLWIPRTTPLS